MRIEDRRDQLLRSIELVSKKNLTWKTEKVLKLLHEELDEIEEIESNERVLNYLIGEEYDPIRDHDRRTF